MVCILSTGFFQNQAVGQASSLFRRVVHPGTLGEGGASINYNGVAIANADSDYISTEESGITVSGVMVAAGGGNAFASDGGATASSTPAAEALVITPLNGTTFAPQGDATGSVREYAQVSNYGGNADASMFWSHGLTATSTSYYNFETISPPVGGVDPVFNAFAYVLGIDNVTETGSGRVDEGINYVRTSITTGGGAYYMNLELAYADFLGSWSWEATWKDASGIYIETGTGSNLLFQVQLPLSITTDLSMPDVTVFSEIRSTATAKAGPPQGQAIANFDYSGTTWGFGGPPVTLEDAQAIADSFGGSTSLVNLNALPDPAYFAWQNNFGGLGPEGDFDLDGDVDGVDFLVWQRNFSAAIVSIAVPEPNAVTMLLTSLIVSLSLFREAQHRRAAAADGKHC